MRNALLSTGDGRKLLAAQLCDATAAGVGLVALPWIVLDGGGSSAVAGLVFAAANLPYVIFGLPAGVVGDRRSRKRVMALSHSLQMLAAATVPIWAAFGHVPIALAIVSAFCIGIGRTYADAAAFGVIAELVGREDFVHGQAALSTAWGLGFIIGPFVGGALIAQIGAVEAVAAEAIALGLAALLVLAIRRPLAAPAGVGDQPMREAIREGIDVIRDAPVLRLLTLVGAAWNLSIIGAEALIVPLLRNDIGLPANEVGWLLGAAACTAAIAGPVVSMLTRRFGSLRLISAGLFLSSACSVGLAFGHSFWTALPSYIALTLAFWIAITSIIGERQRHAPDHLQARVGITGRMIAVTAMTAGSALASGLAAFVELRTLYVAFGVATLAVALWGSRALLRAERRERERGRGDSTSAPPAVA